MGLWSNGNPNDIVPDAFFRESGKVIVTLTVQEILAEAIARKLA